MSKLTIHNFYGRGSPSGEDNVVRSKKAEYNLFVYSHVLYKLKHSHVLLLKLVSARFSKRVKELLNKNKHITQTEIHNIHPFVKLSLIKWLAKRTNVSMYIHNFRLVAPCAVLMDRNGNHCDLCIRRRNAVLLAPFYKCYRKSFIMTLFITLRILYSRVARVFNNIKTVYTYSSYHRDAHLHLFGEDTKFFMTDNNNDTDIKLYNPKSLVTSVAFLGRLSEEKGILDLALNWPRNTDVTLHIYGTGPQEKTLKENIIKSHNIIFYGLVHKLQIDEVLKQHDAVIIPSNCAEGYPTVIGEAVRNNCVLLTQDIQPQSMHVEKLGGFVYQANTELELEKVLKRLK